MAKAASVCTPESMDSEDMLFMLYTSGSTGKPKGIVHTQAGYLLYAALTHKVTQLHPLEEVHLPSDSSNEKSLDWWGVLYSVFAVQFGCKQTDKCLRMCN